MQLSFTIPGVPQQQGSKVFTRTGHGYEANKNLKPWRAVALAAATDARLTVVYEGPALTGAVQVTMIAYFPRPASHYGSGRNAGKLKTSAPFWHASAPDLDKVARALGDVLTASGLILDDRLIVAWDAAKVYGDPRMEVTVTDATPFLPEPMLAKDVEATLL